LQTQNEIEQLKLELDAARIERQNQEECESIRETIAAEPSRAQSMKSIEETQEEISEMERELAATALIVEHRKKPFALLMHVVSEVTAASLLDLGFY
jgi:acyl transferase domain-containing protein